MDFGVALRLIEPVVLRTGCTARRTGLGKNPRMKLIGPLLSSPSPVGTRAALAFHPARNPRDHSRHAVQSAQASPLRERAGGGVRCGRNGPADARGTNRGPATSKHTMRSTPRHASTIPFLVLLALSIALAGCSSSTSVPRGVGKPDRAMRSPARVVPGAPAVAPIVEGGRFVRSVVLGGLSVTPLSGGGRHPLGLSASLAASYVAITGGLASGRRLVGYGSVTLRGTGLPAGTPALRARPAWVGIAYASTRPVAYNCPAMWASAPSGSVGAYEPIDTAVIFYGPGGDGAVLYSTGGSRPCGEGYAEPAVSPADGLVSVPWRQVGLVGLSTTVSYLAPSCASLAGVSANGNVRTGVYSVDVTVSIPFDRAGCTSVLTRTTTVNVYPPNPGPGAPAPLSRAVLDHSSLPDLAPQGFRPPGFTEP